MILSPSACLGTPARISVSFPLLAGDVQPGTPLLLDDGNLLLRVLSLRGGDGEILARVERGGVLSSNRGINLPGQRVSLPSVTEKDEDDIAAGGGIGVRLPGALVRAVGG